MSLAAALLWLPGGAAVAQETDPLPDIPALMRKVEANQRAAEAIQKEYIFKEASQFDTLGKDDGVKKVQSRDFEIFWIEGVRVARLIAKDGKPLSAGEHKKEQDRIDAEVKKAKDRRDKADSQGKETDSNGRNELTVARILELGSFSNPRRETIGGRPTIVVDYTGDPHAKTHSEFEGAFRELAGTVWIDEQDSTVQHCEGHFNQDFKVAGGLVASVRQGTWFKATFRKINDEVWLPSQLEFDGHARYLLFFTINGHGRLESSDYRRFRAKSTIVPVSPGAGQMSASPPSGTPPLSELPM